MSFQLLVLPFLSVLINIESKDKFEIVDVPDTIKPPFGSSSIDLLISTPFPPKVLFHFCTPLEFVFKIRISFLPLPKLEVSPANANPPSLHSKTEFAISY